MEPTGADKKGHQETQLVTFSQLVTWMKFLTWNLA